MDDRRSQSQHENDHHLRLGSRHPHEHEGSPPHDHRPIQRPSRAQIRLLRQPIPGSRLGLVQHNQTHRPLVHQPHHRIPQRRPHQSRTLRPPRRHLHRQPNRSRSPCLLNYWRGSHYGGSSLVVAQGEQWTKVIGPFLIYCNSGSDPQSIYKNALARSPIETAAWPYAWVNGVDYPHKDQRSTVTGQLILNDPQAKDTKLPNLLVGLTAPDYTTPGGRGGPATVDWQNDAKHYEFWTRGTDDGKFSIPNVRPGSYTLHAIADGVLGEFAQTKITITPGKNIDLAQLQWTPLRHGKQIWDIGVPNRTASEFFKGDDYFHWGRYLQYPKLFPNDVNYTIGQSDFHKDWFFEQVPHEIGNDTTGKSNGRETTWTIHFNLPTQLTGKAILRLAIVGIGARHLDIAVNNKPAGTLTNLTYNATINRDGIGGYWTEKDVTFDASLMHPGPNTLSLTVPAGGLTNGIEYDYLRLEQFDH